MYFCPICKYKLNIVRSIEGKTGNGFFECKTCNYTDSIKNGTVFMDANKIKRIQIDPTTVSLDVFPRKILESCSNKKCSKKTNVEAIVWKDDDFNVMYVCTACNEIIKK